MADHKGIRKRIGKRIRTLRKEQNITKSEIADLLEIRQTVYSRYERGFQSVPFEHFLKLADYYNVSADYLLGRTDNPKLNK